MSSFGLIKILLVHKVHFGILVSLAVNNYEKFVLAIKIYYILYTFTLELR